MLTVCLIKFSSLSKYTSLILHGHEKKNKKRATGMSATLKSFRGDSPEIYQHVECLRKNLILTNSK